MQGRGGEWSDDDIYAWFVRSLAEDGSAYEVEPGVVRVLIEPDEDDPRGLAEEVDVIISREQLRTLAWAGGNVFDDRDLDVIPPAVDPVLTGLRLLAMNVEGDLGTLLPDERYLVFFEGRLCKSVRRELPPRGGTPHGPTSPVQPGRYTWTTVQPGGEADMRTHDDR